MKLRNVGLVLVAYILVVSATPYWSTASEVDFSGSVQLVNLVGSKTKDGEWVDPRGLLTIKGLELGLSAQEIAQIRQTVGDVVCPGVQGTAFLVGRGDQLLTNAHIFVDDNGRDRANLEKCFWQNKEIPFQRVPLDVRAKTLKLFTRSTNSEFFLDLAVVRLERMISEAHPFPFSTAASVRLGDKLTMISAGQLRMPSLPKQTMEVIRINPDTAFEFEYNPEPIAQSCTVMAVGKTADTIPNDAIYNDCSATRGASGSPILVRSQDGELTIRGVHVGGGQDTADYTDFTLDASSPKGRSYSNALQLNQDIIEQIERFESESGNTQPR
jgi:Trypsin-like peptidase domain